MQTIGDVFCDGGVIARNPSTIGGTWAFVLLDQEGEKILTASGRITPAEAGMLAITNNYTELLAAVKVLQRLPDGWSGTLHTDSMITLYRLTKKKPGMKNIPADLSKMLWEERKRLRMQFAVTLVKGHPNKDDIFRGYSKNGVMASQWNVLCDKLCKEEARLHLATQPRKDMESCTLKGS